ncbi:TPA: hypothetical protein QA377_004324 [Raoultella ornithinolytica]|nr:hypothetical protein [Raoultella ornithinolytica]
MAADNIFSAIMDAITVTEKLVQSGKLAGTDLKRANSIKSTLANMKSSAFALRDYSTSTNNNTAA